MVKTLTFSIRNYVYNKLFPIGFEGNRSERIEELLVLGLEKEKENNKEEEE